MPITRKDLQALLGKGDGELNNVQVVSNHMLENLAAQRDETLARIEAMNQTLSDLQDQHGKELGEAQTRVQALSQGQADLRAQHAREVQALREAAAAERQQLAAEAQARLNDLARANKDLQAQHAKALEDLQVQHAGELKALQDAVAAHQQRLSEAQAIIEAMGGTERGRKVLAQRKKDQLAQQIAELQRQAKELEQAQGE